MKAKGDKYRVGQKPQKKLGKKFEEERLDKSRTEAYHYRRSKQDIGKLGKDIKKPVEEKGRMAAKKKFWPDVVFGDEPPGLSKIERADLQIHKWERMVKAHKENLPQAVPHCQAMLKEARDHRNSLENDPASHVVGHELRRDQPVQNRIHVLEKTLDTSEFEPERENIRGTIDAYRSKEIIYSKQYTLIWGGKVVGRADSYGEFTKDRQIRLDRYTEQYGPHWLWWETPLWLEPSQRIIALACQVISGTASPTTFTQFHIDQGFQKRSNWVTRMPQMTGPGFGPPPNRENLMQRGDLTFCQDDGPRVVFQSSLDSGASYPSLFRADFQALGIVPELYGAQSVVTMTTCNGEISCRLYEIHVDIIIKGDDPTSGPINLVQPVVFGGDTESVDENGIACNERLSGVMPFMASYLTTFPGSNTIFIGEDRNDVLGANKMPPQRRWEIGEIPDPMAPDHWLKFDDPVITFNHWDGVLIDQDLSHGLTKLTLHPGQPNEGFHIYDAKSDEPKPDPTRIFTDH